MTTTNDASQPQRPGLRDGMQNELTLIVNVIPGQEAAIREVMADPAAIAIRHQGVNEVGTVHNYRGVLFDNDTRFLFATVYDGSWEAYLDDFGASPFFSEAFDATLQHTEGYPGWHSPGRNDWVEAHQVTAQNFTSAYPELTVQQVWKIQRVSDAFQAVLDSAQFQAALKDPANAALMATPAFQKLLDEAAG